MPSQENAALRTAASDKQKQSEAFTSQPAFSHLKKEMAHPLFSAVLTKNRLLKCMWLFSKSSCADVEDFIKKINITIMDHINLQLFRERLNVDTFNLF